ETLCRRYRDNRNVFADTKGFLKGIERHIKALRHASLPATVVEHPHYGEIHPVDDDLFSQRIFTTEQSLLHTGANHHDLASLVVIQIIQAPTQAIFLVTLDIEIAFRHPK